MKKKRRLKPWICLTLAFLLVIGLTPVSLFAPAEVLAIETPAGPLEGICGTGLSWTLTEIDPPPEDWNLHEKNGAPFRLAIRGTGSMNDYFLSGAPWNGHAPWIYSVEISEGVSNIGTYAFYNCVSLMGAVSVPNSVTTIGDSAFYNCNLLESVSCGSGLTSIGSEAFRQTTSLNSFDVTRSPLSSIGSRAFKNSSLSSIALPNSMTAIGDYAFCQSGLSTVTLPAVATTIGEGAFSGCVSLSSVINSNYVTQIASYAFASCGALKEITLGASLSSIGDSAFQYSGLESANIPSSVEASVGNGAFSSCYSLGSASFGSGVKSIGDSAFSSCRALENVDFGSVVSIGESAFSGCEKLKLVSLPGTLASIGSRAFNGTALETFAVPAGTSSIGYGILAGCLRLRSITADGNAKFQILSDALCDISGFSGVYSDGTAITDNLRVIAYPAAKETESYTVPDTMKAVDQYAFYGCKIKDLTLPNSVEALRPHAFESSANLASVTFGKNTRLFALGANGSFASCNNLAALATPSENSAFLAKDDVLYTNDMATLYFYPFARKGKEFHVPETVTAIRPYAFYDIYCPDSTLKELYLPQGLSSLPNYAICLNSKLKSIYFYGNAVGAARSVSNQNAPDLLVYRVDGSEGWDADGWESVTYAAWEPGNEDEDGGETDALAWKYEAFNRRLTLTGSRTVPDYDTDTALPPWYPYIEDIQTVETEGTNMTGIGSYAFYGAKSLLRLTADSRPTKIGTASFANCENLKFLSIEAASEIGDDAFSGDVSLTGTWDSSNIYYQWKLNYATSIGKRAFKNCSSIPRMNLFQSPLTILSDEALAGCEKLSQLTLPRNLASIGARALNGCAALATNCQNYSYEEPKTFTIPASVTEIGAGAMKGCASLKDIALPNAIAALADEALADCSSMTSILLPSGLTSIGAGAMKGCASLVSIEIPESVTEIGKDAFSGNTAMEDVKFKGALPAINDEAFTGCEAGTTTLYYLAEKDEQELWASLGGFWNHLPVKALDHFYTAQRDHYSFSNSPDSFGYDSSYRIPRQRYVDVLDSILKGTYYYSVNKKWAGSCYGMASTTLEFYENINNNRAFDLKNYASGVKSVYDIEAPTSFGNDLGGNLKKLIEAYQISQYQTQIASWGGQISKNMNNYTGLRDRITRFQTTGGLAIKDDATPVVIAVYSLFGGHALVPLSWKQSENSEYYEIEVYDCNYPDETRIMTVNKELNDFEYGFYDLAFSFVDYTAIAEGMSDVTLYSSPADDSLYLSIDKADGEVADASGNGIEKIRGAYEQKPFAAEESDAFSGIKSYVLPSGDYTLASGPAENEDGENGAPADEDVTFYMASSDLFAEVTASDEETELSVQTSDAKEKASLTLSAGDHAEEGEDVRIILMNDCGMEREIEIENCSGEDVSLSVSQENAILVTAPDAAEIRVDGETAVTENGGLALTFEKADPFKMNDVELNASCNDKNRLSAFVHASVVYSKFEPLKDATLIAEFFDGDKNRIAFYTEKRDLNPGLNDIESFRDNLRTSFPAKTEGETSISCRLTIADSDHSVSGQSNDVTVTVAKRDPAEDPEEPDDPPVDPGDDDNKPPTDPDDGDNKPPTDPDDGDNKPPTDPDDGDNKPPTDPDDGDNKPPTDPDDGDNKPPTDPDDGDNKPPSDPDDGDKEPPSDPGSGGSSNITGGSSDTQPPLPPSSKPAEISVTALRASPKKITIGAGESFFAGVTVSPSNATDKTVSYKASNKKISVRANGKVTGKKPGTAWLTITSNDNAKAGARIKVTVKKAPKKISFQTKEKKLKRGKSFQLKVKLPKNTASSKISFTSNKPSVAKVSSKGKILALKKGKATITARTFNGKKARIKITVK